MSTLFPPILEAQRASIPSYVPPATQDDFVIPITLPLSVDPDDVRAGHIQVLIRRQIDMAAWSNPNSTSAPEKDVIYLPGSVLASNNLSITVPAATMKALIASDVVTTNVEEMTGRMYTVQVRFGNSPLWTGSFASWKAQQIANSLFGEWSNTQRIFVYGVPTSGSIINVAPVDDVIGKIEWQYTPVSQDPITQVRVSYSWSVPDSYGNIFRSRNTDFSNSDGQGSGSFGTIDLEAMRFAQITVGIRFTTVNNTVLDWTGVIPAHDFPVDQNAGNRIQRYPIVGEELEDGVLAMTFTGSFRRNIAVSNNEDIYYNIYRVDATTLETIFLARIDGNIGETFTEIIRDYSVEMGAEYIYMAISYGKDTGSVHYVMVPITGLEPNTWNPPLYSGYGRQMNFEGNIFLTTKWQQLRLQGNIAVNNFQRNTSDQFTPTIGGVYPYFSRASTTNYRSFGLQSTITLNFDTTHTFFRFKAQESQLVKDAKTRIAKKYQTAIAELNTSQGDYSQRVQELQSEYYSELKMIYRGINPPPVPMGEPETLPIDWTTGQLWFVEDADNDTIQIRTPDLFSMEQFSLNRKRMGLKSNEKSKWLDSLDVSDGTTPDAPLSAPVNNVDRTRGPSTIYDQHLMQDITEVSGSDRSNNLIFAERKFRDAVMSWLSDGNPKLLRSETEGNMIVMITNISFSPLNRSRQVYSLTATVTEIAEYNLSNLILYGLVPVDFEPFYIPNIDLDFVPGDIDKGIDEGPYREGFTVSYDTNGGNDDGPENDVDIPPRTQHTLAQSPIPTHDQVANTDVVFVGWSEHQDTHIYAKGDPQPDIVTSITVNSDRIVYAVWGFDTTGNGKPDIDEEAFVLSYDVNNGNNDGPTNEVVFANTLHDLNFTDIPTHPQDGGVDVVFVGWSGIRIPAILSRNDTLPTLLKEVTLTADTTVFAVWGYDTTGTGKPDITSNYTLTYDVNGGNNDGPPQVTQLAEGDIVTLSITGPTHGQDNNIDVVFIGWTETQDMHIYAKGDTMPTTINNYTMQDSDATVYAVWGYDTTGSGKPDIEEDTYTLTYDANGGNNDIPAPITDLIENEIVILSTTKPTHPQDNGIDVVFAGWSLSQVPILSKGDSRPVIITTYQMTASDITIYAVWGYDTNGTGEPDIDELTLSYDINGGIAGTGPAQENGLKEGDIVTLSSIKPTHAQDNNTGVVFVGWTLVRDTHIYGKGETPPTTISLYTMGVVDAVVYALWGYDTTGDGKPDVEEDWIKITYNPVAGSGGPLEEYVIYSNSNPHTLLQTPAPVHPDDEVLGVSRPVTFAGWSLTRVDTVYEYDELLDNIITEVMPTNDMEVFAVYRYSESWTVTVEFDDNGGTGGPGIVQHTIVYDRISNQFTSTFTIPNEVPTRDPIELIPGYSRPVEFIGWQLWGDEWGIQYPTEIIEFNDFVTGLQQPGDIINDSDIGDKGTFAAVWRYSAPLDMFTITVDYNGGESLSGNEIEIYDTVPPTSDYIFAYPRGYHYPVDGWDVELISWSFTKYNKIFYYDEIDSIPDLVTEPLDVISNITLYAVWSYYPYTLFYDENGGDKDTGPDPLFDIRPGTVIQLSFTPEPTKNLSAFLGWTDSPEVPRPLPQYFSPISEKRIVEDVGYPESGSRIRYVYAKWGTMGFNDTAYKITFDLNGGDYGPPVLVVPTSPISQYMFDFTSTGSPVEPYREGYDFIGWYNNIYPDLEPGDLFPTAPFPVVINSDYTCYALWQKQETYTLRYVARDSGNPATYPPNVTDIKPNTTIILDKTTIPQSTVSQEVFTGWVESPIPTVDLPIYRDIDRVTFTTGAPYTKNVYARWAVGNIAHIITFDVNEGDVDSGPMDLFVADGYGFNWTANKIPTKEGYEFVTWTKEPLPPILAGSSYPEQNAIEINSDFTVYALWRLKPTISLSFRIPKDSKEKGWINWDGPLEPIWAANVDDSLMANISLQGGNTEYTFTFDPEPGYKVKEVIIDGISQGAITSYTKFVTTTPTIITASFTEDTTITIITDLQETQYISTGTSIDYTTGIQAVTNNNVGINYQWFRSSDGINYQPVGTNSAVYTIPGSELATLPQFTIIYLYCVLSALGAEDRQSRIQQIWMT